MICTGWFIAEKDVSKVQGWFYDAWALVQGMILMRPKGFLAQGHQGGYHI